MLRTAAKLTVAAALVVGGLLLTASPAEARPRGYFGISFGRPYYNYPSRYYGYGRPVYYSGPAYYRSSYYYPTYGYRSYAYPRYGYYSYPTYRSYYYPRYYPYGGASIRIGW